MGRPMPRARSPIAMPRWRPGARTTTVAAATASPTTATPTSTATTSTARGTPRSRSAGTPTGETECDDGISNDGDDFVDCDDFDCDDSTACLFDGIAGLVTAPNVEGSCYSVAVFTKTLIYEDVTFAAGQPYPVVAIAGDGWFHLLVRNAPTIDALPVAGSAWGDGLVRVWVSQESFSDPNLPPIDGTSTDLCWWDGDTWQCPLEFLEGIRGFNASADAFVAPAWVDCKPYVYLPLSVQLGDGSVGLQILAPVR
jgi:hypothetical protein